MTPSPSSICSHANCRKKRIQHFGYDFSFCFSPTINDREICADCDGKGQINPHEGLNGYCATCYGTGYITHPSQTFTPSEGDTEPTNKMKCEACGEDFDPANLVSVMAHEHKGLDISQAIGIHGKKVESSASPVQEPELNVISGSPKGTFNDLASTEPAAAVIRRQLEDGMDPKRLLIDVVEYYAPIALKYADLLREVATLKKENERLQRESDDSGPHACNDEYSV